MWLDEVNQKTNTGVNGFQVLDWHKSERGGKLGSYIVGKVLDVDIDGKSPEEISNLFKDIYHKNSQDTKGYLIKGICVQGGSSQEDKGVGKVSLLIVGDKKP